MIDVSRLEAVSKTMDRDYAPKSLVVQATQAVRTPMAGRVWYDNKADSEIERDFCTREIAFADTMFRGIDGALLANEMVLFDDRRLYLDSSIELEYSPTDEVRAAVRERFGETLRKNVGAPPDERFADATVLISHHEGGNTWGHYLVQSLPRMLLFLEIFPKGKIAVPQWHAEGAPGFGEALSCYGIPPESLAPVAGDTVYRLKQGILLDFLFNFDLAAPHPRVLPLLRNVHRGAAPGAARRKAAYVKRRADANRAISNEADLEPVLARHGVSVFGPDVLSLPEQVDLWQTSDLVIATLGSDLTNMVYARPGTRLLVLSPHWFGDAFFFELSIAAGLHWYELRCGEMVARNAEEHHHSSFNVDVPLLDSVLATLLR